MTLVARQIRATSRFSRHNKTAEQRNKLLRNLLALRHSVCRMIFRLQEEGATLLHVASIYERLQKHVRRSELSGVEIIERTIFLQLESVSLKLLEKKLLISFTALNEARADDIRRQQSTKGPHRDDVEFLNEGKDARNFGSHG